MSGLFCSRYKVVGGLISLQIKGFKKISNFGRHIKKNGISYERLLAIAIQTFRYTEIKRFTISVQRSIMEFKRG